MRLNAAAGRWHSSTTLVFALSASAVGLGNLWRFAYLLGDNGGAPFIIAYCVCLFILAVPVLLAEVVLGSCARSAPVEAFRRAAGPWGAGSFWSVIGWLVCSSAVLVLGYYIVVGGWGLHYAWVMRDGVFAAASVREVALHYDDLLNNLPLMLLWQSVFLGLAMLIVARGVRRGIGLFVWLLLPSLMILLWLLIRYALANGDVGAAGNFLFSVQWLDFTSDSVLAALGHAFYTLSVGLGIGIVFGAYSPERLPLGRSILAVAIVDTAIALAAGVAIFPVVFANHVEPALGPGLLFLSIPYAFGNLPQGELYGALFFLLTVLGALGSAVALLEPGVASLVHLTRLRRVGATLAIGVIVWSLGAFVAASLGQGAFLPGLLPTLDHLTASLMLPLGALAISLFVGWQMPESLLRSTMARESEALYLCWLVLLRFVAPLAILVVLFWSLMPEQP